MCLFWIKGGKKTLKFNLEIYNKEDKKTIKRNNLSI